MPPNLLRLVRAFFLALVLPLIAPSVQAQIVVTDDAGHVVRLDAPARRIVSLAPHVTENLFTAGAGTRIVGATEFSDYPSAAGRIPRVGNASRFDLEAILALRPDLVVGWRSGTPPSAVAKLRALGLTVYLSEPGRLEDIPRDIEQLGKLAGTASVAQASASALRERLRTLQRRYAKRPRVRVFYEVWNRPLLTIGGPQILSEVIRTCSGENLFAGLDALAPHISTEAVLAGDPEVILSGGGDRWLEDWKRWTQLAAVRRGHLYSLPADWLQRPTARLFDGAELLCENIERVRR